MEATKRASQATTRRGAARGLSTGRPVCEGLPAGRGGRPGRRAGTTYGRRGRRPIPARVDETYAAPLPAACPRCGGAIQATRVATQYQEDLPVVQPIVRRFNIQIGCCVACRHRVQGRHPLQTSDALGAAGVQLGPGAVTFTVLLHKHVGVPLEKIATLLQDRFGLTVTPGGLAQVASRGPGSGAHVRGSLRSDPGESRRQSG